MEIENLAFSASYCASCGSTGDLHEHHLVPRSQGGLFLPTVFLCIPCHAVVHDRIFHIHHADLIRAGQARIKAGAPTKSGKPIGRPTIPAEQEKAIKDLLTNGTGVGMNKIALMVGCGSGTVQRIARAMRETDIDTEKHA